MPLKFSAADDRALSWIKSSHSGSSDNNECIEAAATADTVHVRDSKDRHGPRLAFTRGAWSRFLTRTRAS